MAKAQITGRWLVVMLWVGVICIAGSSVLAATPPTSWGNLKAGPYAVGFRTIEQYDQTRTFRPKLDYFGNVIEGERARALQACLWYPAVGSDDDFAMSYGEYLFPNPADAEFFPFVTTIQNRHNGLLVFLMNNDRGPALDALSLEMAAVADATPAEGQFPLVIYHGGLGRPFSDNFVLCEYLASHGFVVVSTHSVGAFDINPTAAPGDYEAMVRDRELAATMARRLDFVDPDRSVVLGSDRGCLTGLTTIMRQTDIDLAVLAGYWDTEETWPGLMETSPIYNPGRITNPILRLCPVDDDPSVALITDSCRYSARDIVWLQADSTQTAFTCDWTLRDQMLADSTAATQAEGYYRTCRLIRDYLAAGFDTAATFAPGEGLARSEHLDPVELPPTWLQLVGIFRSRGADEAIALYDRFNAAEPGCIEVNEAAMNMIGYQLMQRGQLSAAKEAFRINAEAYPASTNVWDSYADGCLASGDTAQAIVCYQTVLKVLSEDPNSDEDLKQTLKNNAEQGLARLRQE